MLTNLWTGVAGWKVKGISIGYILLVLAEKALGVDIPGFEVGDAWLNDIIIASGIFAARDTVTTITGK